MLWNLKESHPPTSPLFCTADELDSRRSKDTGLRAGTGLAGTFCCGIGLCAVQLIIAVVKRDVTSVDASLLRKRWLLNDNDWHGGGGVDKELEASTSDKQLPLLRSPCCNGPDGLWTGSEKGQRQGKASMPDIACRRTNQADGATSIDESDTGLWTRSG
ncbi:hypothetical protein C8R43DRAFT_965786 [Mycena crocata]|nr:hypothetical protein C8R43DRAFT_965786 [Mycena crocata]